MPNQNRFLTTDNEAGKYWRDINDEIMQEDFAKEKVKETTKSCKSRLGHYQKYQGIVGWM